MNIGTEVRIVMLDIRNPYTHPGLGCYLGAHGVIEAKDLPDVCYIRLENGKAIWLPVTSLEPL